MYVLTIEAIIISNKRINTNLAIGTTVKYVLKKLSSPSGQAELSIQMRYGVININASIHESSKSYDFLNYAIKNLQVSVLSLVG